MKYALIIFSVVLIYNLVDANTEDDGSDEDDESISHVAAFESFKKKHNKGYNKLEEVKRKAIYIKNRVFILSHRKDFKAGKHSYNIKMNGFGDITEEEFRNLGNPVRRESRNVTDIPAKKTKRQAVVNLDYTLNNNPRIVSDVQSQGNCGSCYSFAGLDAVESQIAWQRGGLTQLSDQQNVDCSNKYGNMGCGGGLPQYVFNYLKANQNIYYSSVYQYVSGQSQTAGTCKAYAPGYASNYKVTGYYELLAGESNLATHLQNYGPIVGGMDGYGQGLQFYSSGVYTDPNCKNTLTSLDHSVLVVGYGTSAYGEQYWKCKNTWGTNWGMQGYFFIARNKNNMCGIATDPVVPQVAPK